MQICETGEILESVEQVHREVAEQAEDTADVFRDYWIDIAMEPYSRLARRFTHPVVIVIQALVYSRNCPARMVSCRE